MFFDQPDSRGCQICESLIRKVAWGQSSSVGERMSSAKRRKNRGGKLKERRYRDF